MVFDAADANGMAIEAFGNAAEIFVQAGAKWFVAEEGTAFFGGEDKVKVRGGEGLWHVGDVADSMSGAQRGTSKRFQATAQRWPEAYVGLRVRSDANLEEVVAYLRCNWSVLFESHNLFEVDDHFLPYPT